MDFKKVIKNNVAPIILATSISGSVVATNTSAAYAQINSDGITVKEDGKVNVSDLFDTLEEAEKWLNDRETILSTTYEITGKHIYEYSNELIEKEIISIDEIYSTEDEALKRLEELKKIDDCSCDLNVTEEIEIKEREETITVDETFNRMEDLNEYKDSLNGKNNLYLTIKEIPSDWKYGTEEKVIDVTAESIEKLDEEINKIKEKISADDTDDINYDIRIETSIDEKLIPSSIKTENFSVTFDTKEQAQEFIRLKKNEVINDENKNYEFSEISERSVFSHNETTDIDELFSTEEEREAYKIDLESKGYILSDLEESIETQIVEVNVETGNLIVNNSSKLPSNSHYEVSGNFIIIKQASGNVAVWTPTCLTNDQMKSFKQSFLNGNYDPSISSLTNFIFISGNGEFDLSSLIASNWGVYTIEYNNGIINVDCSKDKISHLNYGTYEKEIKTEEETVEKYKLVGKKTIGINKTVYDLNYSLNTQEYVMQKIYSASIFKTAKTRTKMYNLNGTYTEIGQEKYQKYCLKGNVTKNIYGTKYKAEINFEYKPIEETLPPEETIPTEELKSEVPKTGDEVNIGLYSAALASSTLGLIGTKIKMRKRKK